MYMKIKNTKTMIIGIMTLFILTAINPVFTNSLVMIASADPNCEIDVSPSEVYEDQQFTVTALVDGESCNFANINFNGQSSGDGNPYQFTAPEVSEEISMDITVHFSELDPIVTKHASVTVKPNGLVVTDYTITDSSTFHVNVIDKIGDPVCGVTVYAGWGEQRTTGIDGKTRLPFTDVPPIPEGEPDKTYPLSVSKAGYESDQSTIFVENVNIAPISPSIGGPMIVHVGENNVYDYSFSGGADPDYNVNNGVKVKYKYKWRSLGSWHSTEYVKSAESVTKSNYWDEPGEYLIVAKTIDEHGAESGMSSKAVTVINTMPETPTLSGQNYYSEGVSASFTATSSDNEGHEIKYLFKADGINKGSHRSYSSGWEGNSCPATLDLTDGVVYNVKVKATDQWKHEKGEWSDWSNTIRVVKGNIAPETPGKPSVSGREGTSRSFTAITTDENIEGRGGPDSLYYLFDFGDGKTSGWVGPAGAGVTVGADHDYSEQQKLIKTYKVKVKAKDEHGAESGWSDFRRVTIIQKNAFMVDAAMAMKINIAPTALPTALPNSMPSANPLPIYNMVPKTFVSPQGKITRLDDSYSVDVSPTGTYNLKHNNKQVSTNLDSSDSLLDYIKENYNEEIGSIGVPEGQNIAPTNENNDEDEDTNPTSVDSDGDGVPDEDDPCPYDPEDACEDDEEEDEEDDEDNANAESSESEAQSTGGGVVSYSSYDPIEGPCVLCDETKKDDTYDEDKESQDIADSKDTDVDSNTLDVTIKFDGSGTLIDREEQQIGTEIEQVQNDRIEIQNTGIENQGLIKASSIINVLLQKLAKFFPSLERFIVNGDENEEQTGDTEDITEENDETKPLTEPVEEEQEDIKNEEQEYTEIEEESITDILKDENIVFLWDFGDGEIGKGVKPTHTYHIEIDDETEEDLDEDSTLFKSNSMDINGESTVTPTSSKDDPDYEPGDEIAIDQDESSSNHITITYLVTLYVAIDENGVLEDIETIDKDTLSKVEILGSDTTTVTITKTNELSTGIIQKSQSEENEQIYCSFSLLHL